MQDALEKILGAQPEAKPPKTRDRHHRLMSWCSVSADYGRGIVRHLLLRNRRVIGVDFDPEALARWRAEGIPVIYGDASDPELFDQLTAPDPHRPLSEEDRLVLAGSPQSLQRVRTAGAVS